MTLIDNLLLIEIKTILTMNFQEIKTEILRRAKDKNACIEGYAKAESATNEKDFFDVIKEFFHWCCDNQVLDAEIINKNKSLFNSFDIYCNESISKGYLIASGSATVRASGSATVEASGSATVEALDSATVRAWGSATVEAWGSATVISYSIKEVKLSDKAIYRIEDNDIIRYASDELKFERQTNN